MTEDELSTLVSMTFDPTPPAEAMYRLDVVAGTPADVGKALVIDGTAPGRLLVGTGPACALRLQDREVSRRHVAFEAEPVRLQLVDLGSKNGTRVNNLLVRDVALTGGEQIVVGGTTLSVMRGAAPDVSLGTATEFGGLIGGSREMRRLFPLLRRLSTADVPVLLEGETGTGKRLTATTLHYEGPRAERPFAELDCSSLTDSTFDAELIQALDEAKDGTLFISEIGELSRESQAKLMRTLERHGAGQRGRVRVLASTRHDLDEAVVRGRFRDDLFHSLAVGRIELPPLRSRRGDVPLLVAHFCRELGGDPSSITRDLLATWQAHRWPGNVRELRSAVSKRLTLGALADLGRPPSASTMGGGFIASVLAEKLPLVDARARVVEAFEREYVEYMLRETGGNVSRAAAAACVARRYFQLLRARRGV